jgi:hypothetical protein
VTAKGRVLPLGGVDVNLRSSMSATESCRSAFVKSFERREAYESLRGTNPRVADSMGISVFG